MNSYYVIVIEELGNRDLSFYSPLVGWALDLSFFDGFDSDLKDWKKMSKEEVKLEEKGSKK